MSTAKSDLQWYLDNGGGAKASEARGGYRQSVHPHACPGDGVITAMVSEGAPLPLRAEGRPDTIRGKDVSTDVPKGSAPQIASQCEIGSTLKVAFRRNRRGYVCGFEVTGHARFGEMGQDIVCAGVSALAQAALLGLEEFEDHALSAHVKGGYLSAQVEGKPGPGAYGVIRTLELGLSAIERSYPGRLQVTYEEVTK